MCMVSHRSWKKWLAFRLIAARASSCSQLDCLKHFVACHFPNLGVTQELDVFAHLHTSREIARRTFREIVAADHECNVAMRPRAFMLPSNRAAVIQGVRAAGL